MQLFAPKTVDAIVASFKTTIAQLTSLSEEKLARIEQLNDEIYQREQEKTIAYAEQDRAQRIAAKLEEVLK